MEGDIRGCSGAGGEVESVVEVEEKGCRNSKVEVVKTKKSGMVDNGFGRWCMVPMVLVGVGRVTKKKNIHMKC